MDWRCSACDKLLSRIEGRGTRQVTVCPRCGSRETLDTRLTAGVALNR